MDTDKKKHTLREAYDAALKGEAYEQKLNGAGQEFNAARVRAAFFGLVTAALMVPAMTMLLGLSEHGNDLFRAATGIVGVIGGGAVMWHLAWRMMRGNVLEKIYTDLASRPADDDGVQRTTTERELTSGNFGVGQRMVDSTRRLLDETLHDYNRARHWSGSTPEAIGVGNVLAQLRHDVTVMQSDLDVDFARGDARAATLLGVATRMRHVIMELMKCTPFTSKNLFAQE